MKRCQLEEQEELKEEDTTIIKRNELKININLTSTTDMQKRNRS